MTPRENLLALLRRQSHKTIPVDFSFCPHLIKVMKEKTGRTDIHGAQSLSFES